MTERCSATSSPPCPEPAGRTQQRGRPNGASQLRDLLQQTKTMPRISEARPWI